MRENKGIMVARNISWYFAIFFVGMFISLTSSGEYFDGCCIASVTIFFLIVSYILARYERM